VLPESPPIGRALAEVLGDTVFDLDLTPNRGDLLSVLGVAREVGALTGQTVRDPAVAYEEGNTPASSFVRVEISDPDLCTRYVAAIIEDVEIGESPSWMQERLLAAGMRPINNVVDITNYVMLEMGQPLHAFDYEKVRGRRIQVRRASPGERLELIDGSVRDLSPDMLVIADGEGATAVAGVMGGGVSEVTERTRAVLLESANFLGPNIRRTSQTLKLRTDASTRFEKGLSRLLPPIAAARATKLLVELCGGRPAAGLVDAYPVKAREERVTVTADRLARVLGVDVPHAEVRRILNSLGFGCRWVPPDRFVVRVPYWRTDVSIADDVIEEVARIIGYDNLPTSQLRGAIPAHAAQPLRTLRERVKDLLAASGMQEIITYSMTDMESLARVLPVEDLSLSPPLRLANPLSRQHEYARTTLRHGLLQALAANERGSRREMRLFEAGRSYQPRDGDLPHEIESVCGAVTGRKSDRWGQPTGEQVGYFDAKAHVEYLFSGLHVDAEYREGVDAAYLPGRCAEVLMGGQVVGLIGQVHPRVCSAFGVDGDVAMFELDLEAILTNVRPVVHFTSYSAYPAVEQDLAIVVAAEAPAEQVMKLIRSFPLVRDVRVFDVYSGDPIPSGKKSLAFAVSYQAPDRTLSDAEVAKQRNRIIERLRRELGAELRS
jgi:phenylalanyl-tRNA synthetase beta chain